MALKKTNTPPVTPQDVLKELSSSADIVLDAQEELVDDVREALARLGIHNGTPKAHGFEDPASPIRQTIVSEAQRIHDASGIGSAHEVLVGRVTVNEKDIAELKETSSGTDTAQKTLAARVTVNEKDIAELKSDTDRLESAVANPTPATADKIGAIKPDSSTTTITPDGTVSVITSVSALPNSIVMRDANGKIVGDITGTARTAVYA